MAFTGCYIRVVPVTLEGPPGLFFQPEILLFFSFRHFLLRPGLNAAGLAKTVPDPPKLAGNPAAARVAGRSPLC
jgi:hypothetical protein